MYFGNGAYGVQAAVERYFPGTPLAHLSLAQAALLAGLIQSPEALNPIKHPGAAARRRSEVLDAMVGERQDRRPRRRRRRSRCPCPPRSATRTRGTLDYYIDEVRNVLLNDDPNVSGDPAEVLGSTQQARAAAVYRGGLKIYTSYDPTLQFMANLGDERTEAAAEPGSSPRRSSSSTTPTAACARSRTRRTFAQSQFDPATEGPGRQAGSSFKVFTLAAALSRGYSPNDTVSTQPLHWRINQGNGPTTTSTTSLRTTTAPAARLTLTTAIAKSDNCAFVRTELSLGPGNFGADGVKTVDPDREVDGHRHDRTSPRPSCRRPSARTVCTRWRWRRPTRCSPTTACSSGRRS